MRTDNVPRPEDRRLTDKPVRRERLAVLLLAARDGDRLALDEMVRELTPILWQVARAQGLDRDSCADVVQTTWLALMKALDAIRHPEALLGWLVTAARREAWRVRAEQRAEAATDTELFNARPDPGPPPGSRLLEEERREVLWAAVAKLSAQCQELIRIVAFVERPDYGVISHALEMPRGSIGPTRGRCLAKLRELLGIQPNGGAR